MLYRKRIFLAVVILLVAFTTVMFAFVMKNNTTRDYKGTLVNEQRQEEVI